MIEVDTCYDLLPGIDMEAYRVWAKKAVGSAVQASGFVEFRANRSFLGSPQVRGTSVWKTLADWANYSESSIWQEVQAESSAFTTNVKVIIWGPSPVLPEPVRPG
jgi:hypothetical protein